jgi:monofunctional biosynthetic peptidoglycan transglycosylase
LAVSLGKKGISSTLTATVYGLLPIGAILSILLRMARTPNKFAQRPAAKAKTGLFGWLKRLILLGLLLGMCVLLFDTCRVARLRSTNPEVSSLMEQRAGEAEAKGQQVRRAQYWVPLDKISPHLQRAVLAGEDANFSTHNGFDYEAIQKAYEEAQRIAAKEAKDEGDIDDNGLLPDLNLPSLDFKRGASTVSQQLAKNLFLSTSRSFVRKGREVVFTILLERFLSKPRILELYLNVIEWGDGIYGAEAAARYYFNKSAANLTREEAAYLSAMIPSPLNVFNPRKNPKRVIRRQRVILRGMPYVKMPAGTG